MNDLALILLLCCLAFGSALLVLAAAYSRALAELQLVRAHNEQMARATWCGSFGRASQHRALLLCRSAFPAVSGTGRPSSPRGCKMKRLVVLFALLAAAAAHAVQFEIGGGRVEYQKSRATDWWQEGPASQGFYNEFSLKSTSYRVGLVGDLTSSVKYRLGYANLGSVSSRAGATNFDSEYDFDNKRCQSSGCEMVDYIGGGKVDGYYATLAPEYKLGKFAIYGEVGAWVYFPKFDMAKFHPSGAVDRLDIQGGTQYGPVVGFGVRHESMSLSVRFYKTDLNGAMNNASGIPAIYQGYASEVSLGWIF